MAIKLTRSIVEDHHKKIQDYTLPKEILYAAGFPLVDPNSNLVSINEKNYFGSTDIHQQRCRCRETVSLLDENWFYARDCRYHPLKIDKINSRYKCCGQNLNSLGCQRSMYHTACYIPITGNWTYSLGVCRPFNQTNIFALDCEFVFTKIGMEVARVSLVSLYKGVVYDCFVKPKHRILDCNTRFSGITLIDLKQRNVKNLHRVQRDLMQLLDANSILIGHGLHSDLKGLHICHNNIVDTSILYPHFRGFPYRYSLEYLAQKYLGITIHNGESGHDSVEDAKICLQLVSIKCGLFNLLDIINKF